MISFTNVTKQYGPQILFVEGSFQVNPGEKVGLVGPNGAGKTTIFRLITGEETVDEGAVDRPKKLTLGYFRQDVGDLKGRSVLHETVAGAGEVAALGEELAVLEHKMAEAGDDLDKVVERFGEVQARYQELGGYELEARAQDDPGGPRAAPRRRSPTTWASCRAAGRCAWRSRASSCRRPDALLLDEPTNYLDLESILWLESFLRDYPGAVVMTCHDRDVMNRVVKKIVEIDGGQVRAYTGDYDFYEAQRAPGRRAPRGRVRAPAGHACRRRCASSIASARRPPRPRRCRAASRSWRRSSASRSHAGSSRRSFEFRAPNRSGDDVIKVARLPEEVRRSRQSTPASICWSAAASAGRSWARTARASRPC